MKKLVLIAIAMLVAVGAFAQQTTDSDIATITLNVAKYVAITADNNETVNYDPSTDPASGTVTFDFTVDANFGHTYGYNFVAPTVGTWTADATNPTTGTPVTAGALNPKWDYSGLDDYGTVTAGTYSGSLTVTITSN